MSANGGSAWKCSQCDQPIHGSAQVGPDGGILCPRCADAFHHDGIERMRRTRDLVTLPPRHTHAAPRGHRLRRARGRRSGASGHRSRLRRVQS